MVLAAPSPCSVFAAADQAAEHTAFDPQHAGSRHTSTPVRDFRNGQAYCGVDGTLARTIAMTRSSSAKANIGDRLFFSAFATGLGAFLAVWRVAVVPWENFTPVFDSAICLSNGTTTVIHAAAAAWHYIFGLAGVRRPRRRGRSAVGRRWRHAANRGAERTTKRLPSYAISVSVRESRSAMISGQEPEDRARQCAPPAPSSAPARGSCRTRDRGWSRRACGRSVVENRCLAVRKICSAVHSC